MTTTCTQVPNLRKDTTFFSHLQYFKKSIYLFIPLTHDNRACEHNGLVLKLKLFDKHFKKIL